MRRLSRVALGVALCTLATAANARPGDVPYTRADGHQQFTDGPGEVRSPRAKRRAAVRNRHRRHVAALQAHRRAGVRRAGRGYAAHRVARTPVARRSLVAFARGGTARTCLTPAARSLLA